ncbi:MAG: selenium cofactor biosynthesis protein YqeC [Anaerolineaceae bacterium]
MNLLEALEPSLPARIAIVGGGGKTTTLIQLSQQLSGFVWASTTTHLGTDQLDFADRHFIVNTVDAESINTWLEQRVSLLTGDFTQDERVKGPNIAIMEQIYQAASKHAVSLVVEADGARSCPIKAPGINEPAIPTWADMVIVVVGLSAIGKPFNQSTVHRVEPFAAITGLQVGDAITLESIEHLLVHPQGGLKNCPPFAKKIALLNQTDNLEMVKQAGKMAPNLLSAGYDHVLIGTFKYAPENWLRF